MCDIFKIDTSVLSHFCLMVLYIALSYFLFRNFTAKLARLMVLGKISKPRIECRLLTLKTDKNSAQVTVLNRKKATADIATSNLNLKLFQN